MEGTPSTVLLQGDSMRVWNAGGNLIATGSGSMRLSAVGDRIVWGAEKVFDSPIDVLDPGGLVIEGRHLPGRVRFSSRNGGIRIVAVVPLEEYVAAVLSREASPSFPSQALEALAVAVRTYTHSTMATPRDPDYDVVAGVQDQVFEGVGDIGEAYRAAAEVTRGEILQFRGGLARTVYHSTCGGMTESAGNAWGKDVPYLQSMRCEDCRDSPVWRWEYRMGLGEARRIALTLGVRSGEDLRIEVAGRTPAMRARHIRLSSGGITRETKADLFRRTAGYTRMRSLWAEIAPVAGGFRITGNGYGHGVGLCQWGAAGMAKRGAGYREILARYYPMTQLASLSGGHGPLARGAGGRP